MTTQATDTTETETEGEGPMKTAQQIVDRAIDAAGEAGGHEEVAAIAAKGTGNMTFTAEEMATLVEHFGSVGDALYAVQLEAQRRVSAATEDGR